GRTRLLRTGTGRLALLSRKYEARFGRAYRRIRRIRFHGSSRKAYRRRRRYVSEGNGRGHSAGASAPIPAGIRNDGAVVLDGIFAERGALDSPTDGARC